MSDIEFVVNSKTGAIRQAGSDVGGRFIDDFRLEAQSSLYLFNKVVLGLDRMTQSLHLPVCNWLTDLRGKKRKGLLLPRSHLKCVSREFYYGFVKGQVEAALMPDGKVEVGQYRVEDQGEIAPCWRVTTGSGRQVEVTGNHPFLVWPGKWRSVDGGLAVGDWVGVARRTPFGRVHDPKLAYLVGWCLADAYLEDMSVTCTDPCERESLKQAVLDAGFGYTETGKAVKIRGMKERWGAWGYVGEKSAEKWIPEWVFQGDEETVRAFLRGLLKDASYKSAEKQPGVVSYTTISARLAAGIQHLLVKCGLRPLKSEFWNDKGQYKHLPEGYRWWTVTFTDFAGVYGEAVEDSGAGDNFPAEWRERIPQGRGYWLRQQGVRVDNQYDTTRRKVERVAQLLGDEWLQGWCESDVGWEKVAKVEELGPKAIVSLEQPGVHTLAVGDVITHNTSILRGLCIHMTVQDAETNIYLPGVDGPDTRILWASETATHAEHQLGWIERQYEKNELLRALWPHKVWREPKRQASKWNQQEMVLPRIKDFPEATVTSIGVGGAITGHHFQVLIKDDLVTFEASQSEVVMQTAWEWFHSSRDLWDDRVNGLEYCLGTRWSANDIYQRLIEGDATTAPDESMEWVVRAIIEGGKPIFPEMFPMEAVEELMKGGALFWLNYMNSTDTPEISDFDMERVRQFKREGNTLVWESAEPEPQVGRVYLTVKDLMERVGPGFRLKR